jgi:hypothetical protein
VLEGAAFRPGVERPLHHWRDKEKHEVDFVWARNPAAPVAIEAKWSANAFDPANLRIFRRLYSEGATDLIAHDVDRPFSRRFGDLSVRFLGLAQIREILAQQAPESGPDEA